MSAAVKSVLVVEDDALLNRAIVKALRRRFDVMSASSFRPARALLSMHKFDVVISDYQLHDGTGLEILRWLRDYAPSTKRVLVCAQRPVLSDDDRRRQVVEELLVKPCGVPTLLAAIV